VREAFYVARHERKPVVLGVPYDLQKQPLPNIGDYQPSSAVLPATEPAPPNPHQIEQLVEKLAQAKCPIILAGRGVLRSGATKEVEELAEQSGALLATTLLARGMFDHNPFSIGVTGGFARDIARELGAQADLVVAIGASLNYYTVDGGNMFPNAEVVQIDTEPLGLRNGMKAADLYLRADAKLAARRSRHCARGVERKRAFARPRSRGGSGTSRPTARSFPSSRPCSIRGAPSTSSTA
jgi:thiamine pyrophosphate-dependent acetolactate synthase large subunit-like protein